MPPEFTNVAAQLGIFEPDATQPGEFRSQRATFQSQYGGWLCAYLTSQQIDMQVSVHDVKRAVLNLRSMAGDRLTVTRPKRVQVKIESLDGSGMLPMGDKVKGNRLNFGVCPASGDGGRMLNVAQFDWPQFLPVTKTVIFKGEPHEYKTMVNYAVGGDSLVDRAASLGAGEVKMLICNKKHGCKRLMSVCRGKCAEERQVKHQIQVDRRKRAAEARDGAEARKQAKIEADRIFNDQIRTWRTAQPSDPARTHAQTDCAPISRKAGATAAKRASTATTTFPPTRSAPSPARSTAARKAAPASLAPTAFTPTRMPN